METLEDNKEVIDLYFVNSLEMLQSGLDRRTAVEMLMMYEEEECYLACAGVKKAIEWYDFHMSTKLLIEINKIKDKIEQDEGQ